MWLEENGAWHHEQTIIPNVFKYQNMFSITNKGPHTAGRSTVYVETVVSRTNRPRWHQGMWYHETIDRDNSKVCSIKAKEFSGVMGKNN